MQRLTFAKAHRPAKLREELEAGLPALRPAIPLGGERPETVYRYEWSAATGLVLTVPDGVDPAAVAAIVNAHDASAPTSRETEVTTRQTRLREFADNVDAAIGNWGSLTAAQRDAVQLRTLRAVKALVLRELGE